MSQTRNLLIARKGKIGPHGYSITRRLAFGPIPKSDSTFAIMQEDDREREEQNIFARI